MKTNEAGVPKEVGDVLDLVDAECDAIVATAADGKLTVVDVKNFVGTIKPAIEAARGAAQIPAEIKGMSADQVSALVDRGIATASKVAEAVHAISVLVAGAA